MLSSVVGPLRAVAHGLVHGDWQRQLAAGFALGLVVALAPQGHVIAVSLGVLFFALRVKPGFEATADDPVHVPATPHEETTSSCAA